MKMFFFQMWHPSQSRSEARSKWREWMFTGHDWLTMDNVAMRMGKLFVCSHLIWTLVVDGWLFELGIVDSSCLLLRKQSPRAKSRFVQFDDRSLYSTLCVCALPCSQLASGWIDLNGQWFHCFHCCSPSILPSVWMDRNEQLIMNERVIMTNKIHFRSCSSGESIAARQQQQRPKRGGFYQKLCPSSVVEVWKFYSFLLETWIEEDVCEVGEFRVELKLPKPTWFTRATSEEVRGVFSNWILKHTHFLRVKRLTFGEK